MRYYQYTPTIEEFATVTAAAILFGWWLMRKLFPSLLRDLPDWVASGMIISISGVMSLPYRPTIHRIAKSFGIKSHDTLERCVMHTSWNVAIIMAGILNFLLTSVCGSPSMGYLILDDVLCDRRGGKKLPYVYKDYDYVNDRYTLAMRIVFLVWSNGLIKIPVGFALWHKSTSRYLREHNLPYKSKNQLARELIEEAIKGGIPFDYIAFDSWYSSKENLRFLLERGIKFVTSLRSNRKIRFVISPQPRGKRGRPKRYDTLSCKDLAERFPVRVFHKYGTLGGLRARGFDVNLKGVGDLRLVMVRNYSNSHLEMRSCGARKKRRDPHKYILTNMKGLTVAEVVRRYQSRWQIEVFFRDLKQHFALGRCMGRKVESANRHIALICLGYVGVEIFKSRYLDASYSIGEAKLELAKQTFLIKQEGDEIEILPSHRMDKKVWNSLFESSPNGERDNLEKVESLMDQAFSKAA